MGRGSIAIEEGWTEGSVFFNVFKVTENDLNMFKA